MSAGLMMDLGEKGTCLNKYPLSVRDPRGFVGGLSIKGPGSADRVCQEHVLSVFVTNKNSKGV